MKKLLLILLCVPLMFSCVESEEKQSNWIDDYEENEKKRLEEILRKNPYKMPEIEIEFDINDFIVSDSVILNPDDFENIDTTYANGDKYIGEYRNGLRNGQGAFTWKNGLKYVGEWKNDKCHGKGSKTFASGTNYVGEFKDNKKDGKGTYTFGKGPNKGDEYVGEFKDDMMNGQGTYTYANGDKYVGGWKDGKQDARGTYTMADGKVHKGIWYNGEYIGKE